MKCVQFIIRAFKRLRAPGGLALTLLLCKRWIFEHIFIRFLPTRLYFRLIYLFNYWLDQDSRSGPGSSYGQTRHLVEQIPHIIYRYSIRSIVDAPCGDFSWMREVLPTVDVDYIGIDVVPEVVARNLRLYSAPRVNFTCADITQEPLPSSDLWICRDILFHLSNEHISRLFMRFLESQTKYILVTSHLLDPVDDEALNSDIKSGGYRPLNLLLEPFGFPRQCLYRFDDFVRPQMAREMRLYSRQQVQESMQIFARRF